MATKVNQRDEMPPKLRNARRADQSAVSANKRRANHAGAAPQPPERSPARTLKPVSDAQRTARERFDLRKGWFLTEAMRQAGNRLLMAKAEAFYDGEQWSYADAEDVRDRGQNPVVYNEIKPTIDWLIGTERRARVDFVVVAEDEGDEADNDAEIKTKLLKYLEATNNGGYERSWAAEDAFKAGIGWLELGIRQDKSGPPVYKGAVPWRDILWDSLGASKRDLSDARYLFRIKVVDFDVAVACFPGKRAELESVVQAGDALTVFGETMGGSGAIIGLDQFSGVDDRLDFITSKPVDSLNARKRVMLIECWSRDPVERSVEAGNMGDPVEFRVHCSIMTEQDTLIEGRSPFKHDRFPYVPVWAYINRRTRLPYSPIVPLIGPQEALNHRMSKSLWEASANQVWLEAGAVNSEVMGPEELRAEFNAPDGMAVFADGALAAGRVQPRDKPSAVQHQMMLAERDSLMIRSMSGVTGENRGERTGAVSGKAVLAKQDQGSLLTAELFDNLLFSRQLEGEIELSLCEQFCVEPMTVRTNGDGGAIDRTKINQPQPDGTYLNDISARRAHFVVGEQQWKQAYAESAFESLMGVLTQLSSAAPQIVVNLLDLVFDMHPNLPKKAALVARLRQANGQADPSGKMTPEQQQAKAQQEQIAKAKFDAEMAGLIATVKETQAKGEKVDADAMRIRLETIYMSAQAAQVLASVPAATPIADELLKSVGFKDQAGGDPAVIDPSAAPQQPQPMQTQPAPMPQLQQADGAMAGIETPAPDGVQQGAM